jgi:hypothetical protein
LVRASGTRLYQVEIAPPTVTWRADRQAARAMVNVFLKFLLLNGN